MIGYAESADKNGDYRKIQITLIHADDFELAKFGFEKEVYTVDRFSASVRKISSESQSSCVDVEFLKNIVINLRACEIKQRMALNACWRKIGDSGVEIVGFKPLDNVWLPLPVTNDNANGACINITKLLFKKSPKPLEVSFVCDMLNMLLIVCNINLSNPFYNVYNGIFCSDEVIGVLRKLFKKDFLSYSSMRQIGAELYSSGELKKYKRCKVSSGKILKSIRSSKLKPAEFDGNDHCFLVGVKRDCLFSLADSVRQCLEKGHGLDRVMIMFLKIFETAFDRMMALGEIMVIKGHLNRLSDIKYLEFYKLLEGFAFQDKALELKTAVRESANKFRVLSGLTLPDYISSDKEIKYAERAD
ncbi:MAG: hypothetical protein IJB70_02660 [Clostridia bacterium]|nr:hypothetical protein [Clostridia bacterium]